LAPDSGHEQMLKSGIIQTFYMRPLTTFVGGIN